MICFKTLRSRLQTYKPLAWSQLSHQKVRLAIAMTGVAFSNILIFTQLGLRALLFEGVTLLPDSLQGDLFMLSAYAPTMIRSSFPRIYLYEADSVSGVKYSAPLYMKNAEWVNPEELGQQSQKQGFQLFPNRVRVLAFNPDNPVLGIDEVNQQLARLATPNAVLYDRLAQEKLGSVPKLFLEQGPVTTLMNNERVTVVGLFSLGSDIINNGHVIMSDWSYSQRNFSSSLEQVNVGVLTIASGADIATVQAQLQEALPVDIKILTQAELTEAEQAFQASLPNGKVLNFGAMMGLIVGVVIVYQVLFTDVNDHLPEYATLKAMGFPDRSLVWVVLQEALILAVLGFIPGYFASCGVYELLTRFTRIPLSMRLNVVIQVFVLTLFMCAVSGLIAIKKLRSADPAEVF
ncbi:ABC transporter permease DevC [Leptothoe sp. EHU-05/26/07-4]